LDQGLSCIAFLAKLVNTDVVGHAVMLFSSNATHWLFKDSAGSKRIEISKTKPTYTRFQAEKSGNNAQLFDDTDYIIYSNQAYVLQFVANP